MLSWLACIKPRWFQLAAMGQVLRATSYGSSAACNRPLLLLNSLDRPTQVSTVVSTFAAVEAAAKPSNTC